MRTLVDHPLGSMLAARQLVPVSDVERCLAHARETGRDLEEMLIEERVLGARRLLEILENQTFCPAVDVTSVAVSDDLLRLLPRESARRWRALPLSMNGPRLCVALADPDDSRTLDAVRSAAHMEIAPHVGLGFAIEAAIDRLYGQLEERLAELANPAPGGASGDERERPARRSAPAAVKIPKGAGLVIDESFGVAKSLAESRDPVEITDQLLETALRRGATDLHLQPQENGLVCRLRIDGILQNVAQLPRELTASVVSRVKILGGMDIAEQRRPQDGRAQFEHNGEHADLRISCAPSQFGNKTVIRLLRRNMDLLDLEKLQMPPAVREAYRDALENPLGFYLVTGPTGSGKTTTLYATLHSLDRNGSNVSTLEDPIEYSLPGITQLQVNEEIGFDFASGLRALLRQDPDVILVGEIRDVETLEVACRAALTGHKVFSTVHTNDACQAITRLLDMGAPPYLISATLRGVLAQRLVRTSCPDCREETPMNDTERAILGYPSETNVQYGRGCDACGGSGYRGRMAIFEYFKVEENIHRLIHDRASPFAIRYAAQREGMLLLSDFARRAVLDGRTTVAEIQRSILSEEPKEQLCHSCQRVVDLEFTVCPFCHATLKEECGNCGRPVESSWEACAHCGQGLEREWQKLFCRSCLGPVKPHWQHCEYCNAELNP